MSKDGQKPVVRAATQSELNRMAAWFRWYYDRGEPVILWVAGEDQGVFSWDAPVNENDRYVILKKGAL